MSELALARRLRYALEESGGEKPSFDPIVLFGGRTSLIHGQPGKAKLRKGQLILMDFGTAEQQERFLAPLVRGEIRSCFTMTEPEYAGSNPVWMGTTAVKDGDEWVIRGHKWFATGADGAAFAICMALTDPDNADRYSRASMLIVPTDVEGYELIGNLSIMGDRGGDWASHGEVAYHGARIPADHLLGGEGMGFALAQSRLGPGRIHH